MTNSDTFNIVIVGAMNPRIHHPLWYHLFGLINDTERDEAIANPAKNGGIVKPDIIVLPDMAQLAFGDFIISCNVNRWEIKISKPENSLRMIDISSRIFDDLLKHTPVTAFGFNYFGSRILSSKNVGAILAKSLFLTPLNFLRNGATAAEIIVKRSDLGRNISMAVRPTVSPEEMAFLFNFEYKIESTQDWGLFSIRDTLTKRYPEDMKESRLELQMLIDSISRFDD